MALRIPVFILNSCNFKSSTFVTAKTIKAVVWKLILSTKKSLQPDPFLYVVVTIIANVEVFTWKKSGNSVCHYVKL